jgi:O-antigen/teichoic acid export membrane protein
MRSRVLNGGLRMVTLIGRFAVVMFMADMLPADQVGVFGIISAIVTFGVYIVGLDYWSYANRELAKRVGDATGDILASQWKLYGFTYFVAIALAVGISAGGWLDPRFVIWTAGILVVWHSSEEIQRVLIVKREQTVASIVMFLKAGLWGLGVPVVMWLVPGLRSLEFVVECWAGCSVVSLCVGLSFSVRRGWWKRSASGEVTRISTGIRVGLPFLVGTASTAAVSLLDRLFLRQIAGLDAVGAYTVYVGISNALRSLLDAGVLAFAYPSILHVGGLGDSGELRLLKRKCYREVVLVVGVCGSLAFVGSLALGYFVLGGVYWEYRGMAPLCLGAAAFYCLGQVPQYVLFSRNRDAFVIGAKVVEIIAFVSFVICLQFLGAVGVPLAMMLALALGWAVREVLVRRTVE